MQTINTYIQERLILSKNKKKEDIKFNPADTSYEGKIQLSKTANNKLEFHKIYDSDYNLIAWTETWIEGIKDYITTLIVTDDVYDYLLQYVSDYDSKWGFGIIERIKRNEQLYIKLLGLLPECDNLYVTSFEKWYKSRKSIIGAQISPVYAAAYAAITSVAEKIENALIK